jgi:hypothetical protein
MLFYDRFFVLLLLGVAAGEMILHFWEPTAHTLIPLLITRPLLQFVCVVARKVSQLLDTPDSLWHVLTMQCWAWRAQEPTQTLMLAIHQLVRALSFVCDCRVAQLLDTPEENDGWDLDGSEAEADELCNCRFSLAYGGKILLNSATLRLIRCEIFYP